MGQRLAYGLGTVGFSLASLRPLLYSACLPVSADLGLAAFGVGQELGLCLSVGSSYWVVQRQCPGSVTHACDKNKPDPMRETSCHFSFYIVLFKRERRKD